MGWVGFAFVTAVVFRIFIRGDNPGAEFRVGGVNTMKPYDVRLRSWDQRREFTHQVDLVEDHSGRGSPTSFGIFQRRVGVHFQHQVGACLSSTGRTLKERIRVPRPVTGT